MRWERVCDVAAALPGVEQSTSYGTPALKVGKKLLSRFREDGETITLATTFVDRDLLIAAHPDVFFFTDHYRDYPTVLARLATLTEPLLRERLEDAWRRAAPRRLVAEYDAR